MGKPRLIILIRHGQSEGNKNREIHQTVPDHRVKLTPEGKKQAFEAGRKLRALLRPDDTLHFYTSPYRRTRETTEGILSSLTSDDPTPSPFPRHTIKVYEEPRLREQDFGNFQPGRAEMTRMWHERAEYGHFFYRIPNGESASDAYDRVSGFNESLWRSFGEDDFASVCVLVTHGLMTRVFLMKWYHWSVEYFEDLRNINHCEFIVMQKNRENGKYILKNQLRTWTQYKAEKRAEEEREAQTSAVAAGASPVPPRKRYGDAPHDRRHDGSPNAVRPHRQNTADLFREDGTSMLHVAGAGLSRHPSQRSVLSRQEPAIPESPAAASAAVAAALAAAGGTFDLPTRPAGEDGVPFPDAEDVSAGGPIFAEGGQTEASSRGGSSDGPISAEDAALDSPEVQAALMPTTAPTLHNQHLSASGSSSGGPAFRKKLSALSPLAPTSPERLATLRAGRDGGGSWSGTGSRAGSSEDEDEPSKALDEYEDMVTPVTARSTAPRNAVGAKGSRQPGAAVQGLGIAAADDDSEEAVERRRQFRPPRSMQLALSGQLHSPLAGPGTAMAEPLGDQSDMDDDDDRHDDALQAQQADEGGFAKSVR